MRRVAQFLILLIIALIVIPVFLPDKISAAAEKEMNLPAGVIFEEFNNLNRFSKWEPWAKGDSLAQREFFAPYKGKNAGYKWSTKESQGELTIINSELNKLIEYEVIGLKLRGNSVMKVEFIKLDSINTKVRWEINDEGIPYFSRYFSLFLKNKLENQLAEGLDALEKKNESRPLTSSQTEKLQPGTIEMEIFEGKKFLALYDQTSFEKDEIRTAIQESLGFLNSYLRDHIGIEESEIGKPTVFFESIDPTKEEIIIYCGFPVSESVEPEEGMQWKTIPTKETLITIHKGNPDKIEETINSMKDYAKKENINLDTGYWLELPADYLKAEDSENQLTKIYIPIKN